MYQVIKTIKGRPYLYEQSTYRENGKVKTVSRYIGAVDPVTRQTSSKTTPTTQEAQTVHQVEEALEPPPEPPNTETPPKKEWLTLQIHADFKPHKISQKALESEYFQLQKHQQERGLKPIDIPKISIVQGKTIRLKKSSKGYTVSLPQKQQKGGRAEFWPTFRKATAHSYLDAIEKRDPKYFTGLKTNLEKSYQQQNRAIAAYIMFSKRKDIYKIGLTLHFLYSKTVSAWTQRHLKSEKIGLSDYSDRSNWRDDTAALMGEIQKDGWRDCYKKYMLELKKIESWHFKKLKEYRKAGLLDRLSGKRRTLRQEILKINARRRAIFAACDKISVLSPLFDGYSSKQVGMNDPFTHEENWKRTRQRWQNYFKKK